MKHHPQSKDDIDESLYFDNTVEHVIYKEDSPKPILADRNLDDSTKLDFGFELDVFQKESIKAINTLNSVVVIASTSAGKSVVAYHAVSKSIENKKIAIYTSPVKSLANQKYVELYNKFNGDVGLITGDVTNNVNASCLVMTAEVLRNQLFSEMTYIKDILYVILDEAHYICDPQRGFIWEQIIISCPENVRFVLLTATLPNYYMLAQWISKIKKKDIHCVFQKKRPVPLRIYALNDKASPILLKNGEETLNYKELSEICSGVTEIGNAYQISSLPKEPPCYVIANHANKLIENGKIPLILFCLSRKRCAKVAKLINGIEDNDVLEFFDNASENWDPDIKNSKQFQKIRNLISMGIGIHHSGIIPIIRETIEILFSKGKLIVLIATETFALGVNAPAKAVMFSSIVKWGGTEFRTITSSEFLQMAGRAGRRGYDEYGDVYVYVNENTDPDIITSVIGASPTKLVSRMKVTSSLIISCLFIHINPHEFLEKSLMFYMNQRKLPFLKKKIERYFEDSNKTINQYAKILSQFTKLALSTQYIKDVLRPGRLLYIVDKKIHWGWCSLVSYELKTLTVIASATKNEKYHNVPSKDVSHSFLITIKFPISSVFAISDVVMKNPITNAGASRSSSLLCLIEHIKSKFNKIPLYTFPKNKTYPGLQKLIIQEENIYKSLQPEQKSQIYNLCYAIEKRIRIENKIEEIENPPFHSIIDNYHNLFKKIGYLNNDNVIQIKGLTALSIHVEDPLPIVEILFNGFFTSLDATSICIATSCFVESPPKIKKQLPPSLTELWISMKNCVKPLLTKLNENNLPKSEYPKKRLMLFVYQFLTLKSINKSVSLVEGLNEGVAVRILKRIRELLVHFESASVTMKVQNLTIKFKEAQDLLNNGCKFDSSLYKTE